MFQNAMSAINKGEQSPATAPRATGSNPDQVASLKSGEYMVHVFISETRGLRHPKHSDSTVDPILEIKAFGKTRYSRVQKEVGSGATYWGDHFFFEKYFETTFQVEHEKITLSVLDHNTIGPDAIVGTVVLNIPAVYSKENHCLEHQWAALSGVTQKYQEVLGFIKFSVGVFAKGDEQKSLTEEKAINSGAGPNKLNVLYPPQIVTEPYQIRVKVFKAEKLKKMDTFGKTDPYVRVLYGGLEAKTTTLKVTLDPVWNEELFLPASLPTINEQVVLELYDWDAPPQKDEHMGTVMFNIKDIMQDKYKQPFWVNIYGSPSGAKSPYEEQMNQVPELGTEWKGRVQVALTMKPQDKPVVAMHPITEQPFIKAADSTKRETYELRAEVYYAQNLRKDGEDFTVKFRWGSAEGVTKKKTSKNRMIEIYESLLLSSDFPSGFVENAEIPDVFVYIANSAKNLSFVRLPWTDFRQVDAKFKDFYFKVDRSCTTTTEDLAGIVKMRMYICKTSEKPATLSMYGWDRAVNKSQMKTGWRVHCNIYQAKDLAAGDASGLSDPFLNVYFNGTELKTSVIAQTVNPIWNERLEFSSYFDDISDAPPMFITVWDYDSEAEQDFTGSAIIQFKKEDLNPQELPLPKWINIKYGKDGLIYGKVLMSVCCYNRPELIPRTPSLAPDRQKYFINMKVLGLRDLESIGILPVKRAFVRFDIDSLKDKAAKQHLPEKKFLRTEPVNPGSNPNILTVINLEVDLPCNPEYCPALSCSVFDYIFRGMSQPLLGNFSIPLGDFIKQTSAEMEERIEKLTKLYYAALNLQKKLEESRHIEEPSVEESEVPLLGRFMGPLVGHFASIKKDKGFLPGESDDVAITIFDNPDFKKGNMTDPLDDVTEENSVSKNFVIFSKYTKEGDEIERPDPAKYMELGHNNKKGTHKKHYRYYLNTELENSEFVDASPFVSIPLYRGKKVEDNGLLSQIFGKQEAYRCVGNFKAMINIMSENDKMRFDSKIKHVGKYAQTRGLEFSDDEFLRKRDVIVRLYIIEAENLADKDDDSNSDPYLIVKLGQTEYNEKDFYQQDNPNPKFHKCFEFPATLPGASKLTVELWDYDRLDADDLIGKTVIDIEDRWYSSKWRSLKHIPVETRHLYHPSSSISQGSVKLWVEILPKDIKKDLAWNISPKSELEFELRAIVWECKDVPNVDFEDASDIYITGKLSDGQHQRTDTHFRSQNGIGKFNWRMVFPVKLPMKKPRITFQIWDKDLLSSDDYISEATFDFDQEVARAFEKEEIVDILGPSGNEKKFWIQCSSSKTVNGRPEPAGSILVYVYCP